MLQVEPLVHVVRGGLVDAVHMGALVVVDADGRLLYHVGDPHLVAYPRSSAKPLQVLPLLESGAADHFGFTDREIAIMCASHSGEDVHIATVQGILERIGLDESALLCGVHAPAHKPTAERMRDAGLKPNSLHSNCSGKHAGMLALARFLGVPTEGYVQAGHPVQQRVLATVAAFSDMAPDKIILASDGCTVPTFGMPLYNFALAVARLVQPQAWEPALQAACRRVVRAMQAYPEMVGGTGRFDTDLMRVATGTLISKGGADGYHCAGILPCAAFPNGAGIALKVLDGDVSNRARPLAMLETLRQLGVLTDDQLGALAVHRRAPVLNMRGEKVGETRAQFSFLVGEQMARDPVS